MYLDLKEFAEYIDGIQVSKWQKDYTMHLDAIDNNMTAIIMEKDDYFVNHERYYVLQMHGAHANTFRWFGPKEFETKTIGDLFTIRQEKRFEPYVIELGYDIPFETFKVMKGDSIFCYGIVCHKKDLNDKVLNFPYH